MRCCLKCDVYGWAESAQVDLTQGAESTCVTQGYHIYQYGGNWSVPNTDRTKRYTSPLIEHKFVGYQRNHDATYTQNETETSKCYYSSHEEPKCTELDTREISNTKLAHDLVPFPAKNATCTKDGWEAYKACKNCDYTTYQELPTTGRSYAAEITKPTCTKDGYTTYTCTNCKDTYTDQQTAALNHRYDDWTSEVDGTHSAECRRTGCGYIRNVACTVVSHKLLTDDQNMLELTLCLVCGGGGSIAFARVANASAKAED